MSIIGNNIELPIGTILDSAGPPNSNWKICNGDVLLKSEYPQYCSKLTNSDLHPNRWGGSTLPDTISISGAYARYAISNIGNNIVIIGSNNFVHVSDDGGLTFSSNTNLPATGSWYCLANNGSRFVAIQYNSSVGAYSDDYGVTWTQTNITLSGYWHYLKYNGSIFLASQYLSSTTPKFAKSSDGIAWTIVDAPHSSCYFKAIETDGTNFLVYADYTTGGTVYKGTDGENWTDDGGDIVNYINDEYNDNDIQYIGYGKNKWYFFNYFVPPYNYVVSSTGISNFERKFWNSKSIIFGSNFNASKMIDTGEDLILFNSYNYFDGILISNDGENWITQKAIGARVVLDAIYYDDYICFILNGETSLVQRLKYTSYDSDLYFQLPNYSYGCHDGVYKYIRLT